jgi:hypothetical protein
MVFSLLTVFFAPAHNPGETVMSMTMTVKMAINIAVFNFMARPLRYLMLFSFITVFIASKS